jgi:hypothetical protein
VSWITPTIEWRDPASSDALDRMRTADFELITTWPALPDEASPTLCYRHGSDFWIQQSGVGAVACTADRPGLVATRDLAATEFRFKDVVLRSWLPAICPLWGRQVIHASGAVRAGDAVAFTGFTHAGKSTTAFGLSQRAGWRLLADDTIAFEIDGTARGAEALRIFGLPNQARLRPASQRHFDLAGGPPAIAWPDTPVRLRAAYVLDGQEAHATAPEFTRLHVGDALPLLMAQAYALSLDIPKYNQQLMMDYTRLASIIPVFRLTYRRSFEAAEALFAAIDAHVVSHVLR